MVGSTILIRVEPASAGAATAATTNIAAATAAARRRVAAIAAEAGAHGRRARRQARAYVARRRRLIASTSCAVEVATHDRAPPQRVAASLQPSLTTISLATTTATSSNLSIDSVFASVRAALPTTAAQAPHGELYLVLSLSGAGSAGAHVQLLRRRL